MVHIGQPATRDMTQGHWRIAKARRQYQNVNACKGKVLTLFPAPIAVAINNPYGYDCLSFNPRYIKLWRQPIVTKKQPDRFGHRNVDGKFFVIGPRGGNETFRTSFSGKFETCVMAKDTFRSASKKANSAIKEALRHPPGIASGTTWKK